MKYYLWIFILSLIPITELRGSLPLAITHYHLNFWLSLILGVLGSLLGGVLVLLFLQYFEKTIGKVEALRKIKDKIFEHTQDKQKERFRILKEGLIFILATIPIPILGGSYTAALVAYLFGANKIKSIFYIFLGLFIQGFIIAMLSNLI